MHSAPPPYAFDEPLLGKSTLKVALAMAALIVCGVLGVAAIMKLQGYGLPHRMNPAEYKWSSIAVFFRTHGFQLLWVPVLWTALAVFAQRRDRGEFHMNVLSVGVFLIAIFVILFFIAAVRPVEERFRVFRRVAKKAEPAATAAAPARAKQE